MTFFENQAKAKRNSLLLIGLFTASVVSIIFGTYIAIVLFLISSQNESAQTATTDLSLWQPEILAATAIIMTALIGLGTLTRISKLMKGGGASVAEMLGGSCLSSNTTDGGEKKILNIVEEMAIASGIRVPPVYLLPDPSINAFAAGFSPNQAVIGISKGSLDHLTRDELQGVIAHEFSHIIHGDMALNIKLIGLLNGLLFVTITGRHLLYIFSGRNLSSSRDRGGNPLALVGLIMLILGSIGVFFGNLIQMALSRQREFLADASSVQYTRNPDGIAGALKKIGGFVHGARISSPNAQEASHMFFADGLKKGFNNLFATHPPLAERIRRIDPHFRGEFPLLSDTMNAVDTRSAAASFAGQSAPPMAPTLENVVGSIGRLEDKHIDYARSVLQELPLAVNQHIRTENGAEATVYCLLLDSEEDKRKKQLTELARELSSETKQMMNTLHEQICNLDQKFRLPVLEIALPVLENMQKQQYQTFRNNIHKLILSDEQITRFEYVAFLITIHSLDRRFGIDPGKGKTPSSARELLQPVSDLLLSLAFMGNDDTDKARKAYRAGAENCGIKEELQYDFNQYFEFSVKKMDKALSSLKGTNPEIKEKVIRAAVACILADSEVTTAEAELIRGISAALDCPMPPLV